ncbi:MAG: transcriptional regulator [Methanobacterium sp.]|nr:MAG: transcriptional regulator [Methanobacterium sp.]
MARSRNYPEYNLNINGKTLLLDKKRFDLLKKIDSCGSIMNASKKTGVPYRSALKYIEVMEEKVGTGVVYTKRGGKGGGGGSQLSATGKLILKEFTKVQQALRRIEDVNELEGFISHIEQQRKLMYVDFNGQNVIMPMDQDFAVGDGVILLISPEDIFITLEPIKSSARNIMPGQIAGLKIHNDLVRLEILLNNGELIKVDVTQYSKDKMSLDLGKQIFIGFKAVSISLVRN